ncbi:RNA-directed DNA polymerase [Nostoc sp. FACHB-280]|uniref:RNA-directed DNA polymerase n=1 Tax=Nostoc sp. FACHB-280 TaxID=2692839 RepID=UPI00168BC1A1|nr:RNA-directed DNA polymerase [Nostoc sp. FACHB-280]MBD2494347.1 RNA-directed DNA polymerase [Nostoc sp. FACHB-280]
MLTLKQNSLNWALAHALKYGDTDVFPLPFEYEAIQHDWQNLRSWIEAQNILDWQVRPHRTLLSPKAKYGFRVITQLDPLDFLVFAATVKEIASDIENSRIPANQNLVFSYRFKATADGQIFDPSLGYSNFQNQTQLLLKDEQVEFIVVTDIADFYSRIYHHRLENALQSSTKHQSHVKAIMQLLAGWNGTETFGIPVGNAPSRLLAEITLADVDEALLANSVRFIRFNDDYRIFAKDYAEAYRHLAFLADILFRNHGLTLQPQKTNILSKEIFKKRYLASPEDREVHSLEIRFDRLISVLGLGSRYERIEYKNLKPEQKKLVDSLNLVVLFHKEIHKENEPDLGILRFILRRMGQLGDSVLLSEVLNHLDVLHPVFPDIIHYLNNLRNLSNEQRRDIGAKLINLLEDSIISELDYHRMWALDIFTRSTEWGNENQFFKLLGSARDMLSRRQLILAMGRASQRHWFQSQWRSLFNESHWPRRALLAGASCMSPDARKHWYKSVEPRLDPLEKAVMKWAKQNPFGS